jgi:hypothetical protein
VAVAKDKATAYKGKGKRSRERQASARESDSNVEDELEGDVNAQKTGSSVHASKNKSVSRASVQEPKPWRATVALM